MQLLLPFALLLASAAAAGPAEDATRAAIARVGQLNAQVHAVIALDPTALAQARSLDRQRRARGALFGLPVLVKDNIEIAGPLPTTAGSLALAANVSGRDAPIIARLRAAGAVIVGKTNLSEWANFRSTASVSGWSATGGQTRNPYALDRNPCGSSSGSAAAVAAGMVAAAIGSETDGSVTCPASTNGVVGLKPTVGLLSRTGIVPISASQDTAGPIAVDVPTTARLLSAMAGSDPADPATIQADRHRADYSAALTPGALRGARLAVLRDSIPASTLPAFERALATLKAQGAVLIEVAAPADRDKIGPAELIVLKTEFKAGLNAYLARTPAAVRTRTLADVIAFNRAHADTELSEFGQELLEQSEATIGLADPAYREARAASLKRATDALAAMLGTARADAIVTATATPAWLIDPVNGDQVPWGGWGDLAAVAGTPHLSVPMGQARGLPVGLSFMGPAWSEARLLALGADFERARGALPAATLRPSLSAGR